MQLIMVVIMLYFIDMRKAARREGLIRVMTLSSRAAGKVFCHCREVPLKQPKDERFKESTIPSLAILPSMDSP